jgi:TRAP-type C4-dicarboxylate transport system permease small subunit
MGKAANWLNRWIRSASKALSMVGLAVILVIVCWTAINVILRIFDRPITGTVELTEHLMIILICSGLAFAAALRGHIVIDVVASRFPKRLRDVCDVFVSLVSLGIFSLFSWRLFVYGSDKWRTGELSPTLKISITPFAYFASFAIAVLCLVLLLDLISSLSKVLRR